MLSALLTLYITTACLLGITRGPTNHNRVHSEIFLCASTAFRFSIFSFPPANIGVQTEIMTGHLTSRSRAHRQSMNTLLLGRTRPDRRLSSSNNNPYSPCRLCTLPPHKTCSMATCTHA